MKTTWQAISVGLIATAFVATSASADFIENTSSGDMFDDEYSYLFTIAETGDSQTFLATLTNTSPDPTPGDESDDPLISLLAFNINADLGVDYDIENISSGWAVDSTPPGGFAFDVLLRRGTPDSRLAAGESLTFEFVFIGAPPMDFDVWLDTLGSLGTGIGGGTDFGQKAVRFQQLGEEGDQSDLLADDWNPDIQETTEPSALVLLGGGLLGLASMLRRRARS